MQPSPTGAPLEVRGLADDGFPFAWFEATLDRPLHAGDKRATVRLTHFTEEDGSPSVELVAASRLRPPAPGCSSAERELSVSDVYPPGSAVDARWEDVWWEAVVQDVPGPSNCITVAYSGACDATPLDPFAFVCRSRPSPAARAGPGAAFRAPPGATRLLAPLRRARAVIARRGAEAELPPRVARRPQAARLLG